MPRIAGSLGRLRMEVRREVRSRSGFRRARRLRSQRRGVVAVVGTLLALLVFFALFGVFLTQYLPLWMEENESQLSNSMESSFATLKGGVDDQYLIGGIPSFSVAFTLNSQSVPLLAQPTVADLVYSGGCPSEFNANGTPAKTGQCDFQRLSYATGAVASGSQNHPYTQIVTTNYLQASLPDRYYVPVAYFLEADGVIQAQSSSHQTMVVPPPFNVTKSGTTVTVLSSLVGLVGNSASYSSQGTKVVTSTYVSASSNSSSGRFLTPGGAAKTFNVTYTVGVHAVCAWYNFLYNVTYNALGASGSGVWTITGTSPTGGPLTLPPSSSVCALSLGSTYDLTLTVYGVSAASTFVAQDQLAFNAGGL